MNILLGLLRVLVAIVASAEEAVIHLKLSESN